MLDRVAETISRYSMFAAGGRVGVAVSGGSDSVALLRALVELGPRWRLSFTVLHVNHGLRGAESDGDEAFVRGVAASLAVPVVVKRVETADGGGNLEERARHQRYRFFEDCAREYGLTQVATGHTLDDQAETVVFRLLRGTGVTGLAGILAVTKAGVVRPLIEMREADVRRWLEEIGQPWREDSSNLDRVYARNRIRTELLPVLRTWNPRVEEALAHVAELAAGQDDYIGREAGRAAEGVWREWCGGLVLDLKRWAGFHPAIRGRLLRLAMERVRGDLRQIDWAHVKHVERLATKAEGRGAVSLPGLRAVRSFHSLLLILPGAIPGGYRYAREAGMPEWWDLPGRRLRLSFAEAGAPGQGATAPESSYNTGGTRIDRVQVCDSWELRSWRPGDRFHPQGFSESKKLKELFHLARVPSWERPSWPIISVEGAVLWVSGFGTAAGAGNQQRGKWRSIEVLEEREGIESIARRIGVNSEPKAGLRASEIMTGAHSRRLDDRE